MAIGRRWFPTYNQLYWRCKECGEEVEWPGQRIAKYCSDACRKKVKARQKREQRLWLKERG